MHERNPLHFENFITIVIALIHLKMISSLLLLFLTHFSPICCELPMPSSSTDPAMINYLQKMWDGYNRAVLFRQEQLPIMNYKQEVIVFNDRTFDDHIIDFDAILIFFHGSGCDKCDQFMTEYLDTSRDLLMWEPHISMGIMDCSKEGIKTCNKVG